MKWFIAMVLVVFVLGVFVTASMKSISLKQNCTGYLKRAADANTVETARTELQKALRYLEENGMTKGYTSILWKTADEDVGFWYENLKASEGELLKVTTTSASMEKTNLLMKLRETLLDNGEEGDKLTVPDGLSRFPNNAFWGLLLWMASVIGIGLVIWGLAELE
ncbi:MAG: hypothetical protein Q8K92_08385 [Leadbetterella sp.]|nr:hypothetical protein [Leadbetterella sp.]